MSGRALRLDVLAETAPEDRLRGYDSENNAVLFHEDAYELGPVSGALEELQRRAEEEMVKPRFTVDA